ncbi:hypothetical protein [Sphingomonas sp.]|uniref:hypothetical protein n=1 Tax=Sphingomonas sp. TaxID=28214 RepID=UPI0031DD8921
MAYREKLAWLTLVAMLAAYTIYFTWLLLALRQGEPSLLGILLPFGIIAGTQGIIVAVTSAVLSIRARREGQARADERDRAIARRGATAGYYTLMAGMILAGVVMPFTEPAWKIVNTALLAIVVAETVSTALIILSYRRGWHG